MSFLEQAGKRSDIARRVSLFLGLGLLLLLVAGFFWATSTPGSSYSGSSAKPLDTELAGRLEGHVIALSTGSRNLERQASIMRTVAYLEGELRSYGYDPQRQTVVSPADNVIVRLPAPIADAPILIVGAHYDTAGASPGADDNASGIAALLELARSLKSVPANRQLALELVFFANEEPPHFKTPAMGSFVHAQAIPATQEIVGMISLETMGYYSDEPGSQDYPFPLSLRYPGTGNFIAFVGDTSARDFLRKAIGQFRESARIPSIGGTAPSFVRGIDWSDHWAYSERGIDAFMITDTAIFRNPNYHRTTDTADTLDYARLALVVEGLEDLIRSDVFSQ